MVIKNNTPIEKYTIKSRTIYVKREDLCTYPPAPPFSKCRGLAAKMRKLKDEGIETVGYVESSISMAGWGVAWIAQNLGMKAVIFNPQYANQTPSTLKIHRSKWKEFEPDIISIKAGRTSVNLHISKKILFKKYDEKTTIMFPTGLPFPETVEETAKEWQRTRKNMKPENTIICIGSGTICAGLLKGMKEEDGKLTGILAYSRNLKLTEKNIWDKSGKKKDGLFKSEIDFKLIDPGWKYTEQSKIDCPFPCHSYYDLKAWQWMIENVKGLKGIILFWNIGSEI